MSAKIHLISASLLLLIGACPAKEEVADTDSTSNGETASTTDDSTDSATSDGEETEGTETEGTETPTTSDSTTDDEPAVSPEAACQALCNKFDECGFNEEGETAKQCADQCNAEFVSQLDCPAEFAAVLHCAGTQLTCQELDEDGPEAGACAAVYEAFEQCADIPPEYGECSESGEGSDTECKLTVTCENEPTEEFRCDTEVCECLLDGEVFAECPSEGVCEQDGQLVAKRLECCQGDI